MLCYRYVNAGQARFALVSTLHPMLVVAFDRITVSADTGGNMRTKLK